MWNRTVYLSFSDWLISLSMRSSWFIHVTACIGISFPFKGWVIFHCYICHVLFVHSSLYGHWVAVTFWLLWVTTCQLHFERKRSMYPKSYCFITVFHDRFENSKTHWKNWDLNACVEIIGIIYLLLTIQYSWKTLCHQSFKLSISESTDWVTVSGSIHCACLQGKGDCVIFHHGVHIPRSPVIFMERTLFQGCGVLWGSPRWDAF